MLRRPVSWLTSAALLLGTVSSIPFQVQAQPMPVQAQGQVQLYAAAQLDSILAPVALYPDVLLTQVLMASAFPGQVVEAGRWVQNPANRQLQGDALAQALASMEWDPSVKSLVPFPGVLAQLNGNQRWLEQLGYASVNQQGDVLDAVQRLRHQASLAGHLRSSPQYIVRQEARFIYIEPAQPNVVYVPAYNPILVYGTWGYPAYPPVYLAPPQGYGWEPIIGAGLFFSSAILVSTRFWDVGRPYWADRRIVVNVNTYNTINVNRAPYSGGQVWQPQQTTTYNNETFRNRAAPNGREGAVNQPSYPQGGAGMTGPSVVQPGQRPLVQGAPGAAGRPDVSAPGLQPRTQGAPGTAGQSGVTAPGLQPRAPGAPGTAGQSGVLPPSQQGGGSAGSGAPHATPGSGGPSGRATGGPLGGGGGSTLGQPPVVHGEPGAPGRPDVSAPGLQPRTPGAPGTAGQSGVMPPSQPGGSSMGSGAPHAMPGAGMPSGGQPNRAMGGPSGGDGTAPNQPRAQGGGNAAPNQNVAPQGGAPAAHGGGAVRQDNKRE